MGFLTNLVKVFPSLATRPLYLTGESYCGVYIVSLFTSKHGIMNSLFGKPYITKAYFNLAKPPVKLAAIAIGDGIIDGEISLALPILTVIETYPQLIGYDPEVFAYFKEQEHLCGLDVNFTYPQNGIIPTINFTYGTVDGGERQNAHSLMQRLGSKSSSSSNLLATLKRRADELDVDLSKRGTVRHNFIKNSMRKRDLTGRSNGTIDPYYGCDLFVEVVDYAVRPCPSRLQATVCLPYFPIQLNFTLPWSESCHNDKVCANHVLQVKAKKKILM